MKIIRKFENKKTIMKNIKNLTKRITWLYNSYIWNPLHFWYMKNKAIKLNKLTGKRYFVVPATETKLIVVDNNYIKAYNQAASKNKKMKKININDLIKMAYFATSTRSLING